MAQPPEMAIPRHGWPDGLRLIHAGYREIRPQPQPLTSAYAQQQAVEVPANTQFVHVAVTAVDWSFGDTPNEPRNPSPLASMWFEISNRRLGAGEFRFDFKALLQNAREMNPTGNRVAVFWVEVLCFG